MWRNILKACKTHQAPLWWEIINVNKQIYLNAVPFQQSKNPMKFSCTSQIISCQSLMLVVTLNWLMIPIWSIIMVYGYGIIIIIIIITYPPLVCHRCIDLLRILIGKLCCQYAAYCDLLHRRNFRIILDIILVYCACHLSIRALEEEEEWMTEWLNDWMNEWM